MGSAPAERPIRLAFLECDTPFPELGLQYATFGNMFEALWRQNPKANLADQLAISSYQVDCDDAHYPVLSDIDAILITGSRHSAYEDLPWIKKLLSFTTRALQTPHVKLMGVCFGHQVIGRALGAEVKLNELGWGTAVQPVDLSPIGQALFGKPQLSLQFMHHDIVLSCPPGVQNLGSTSHCAVQGLYKEGKLMSVQGHPEFTGEIFQVILAKLYEYGLCDEDTFKGAIPRVSLDQDGLLVATTFWQFMLDDTI